MKLIELTKRIQEEKQTQKLTHIMSKIIDKSENIAREKITSNATAIIEGTLASIDEKLDTLDTHEKIIEAIDNGFASIKGNEELQPHLNAIKEEIVKMITEVQKLESKTYFDNKAFNKIFSSGIEKITNLLSDNNLIPNSTNYNRNSEGKITRIVENYGSFTLEHTWKYNGQNELVTITTKRT